MYGILAYDNVELVGHSVFNNYRLALYNYFGKCNFKDVLSRYDVRWSRNNLDDITHLFIVDEHYEHNKASWKTSDFINNANSRNIKVIIFNFEKIFNSSFPWNIDNQNHVNMFKNVVQFNGDVEDAELLGRKVINKYYLSRSTDFGIPLCKNKKDGILFIGRTDGPEYEKRRDMISEIRKTGLDVDVVSTSRKLAYSDYLNRINEYKYSLSPLGTGKFLGLRYYELLYFNTIPIQQVDDIILRWYPEIIQNCICFSDPSTIADDVLKFKGIANNKYYLEDYFNDINLKGYL